jgi:hypothetical protein
VERARGLEIAMAGLTRYVEHRVAMSLLMYERDVANANRGSHEHRRRAGRRREAFSWRRSTDEMLARVVREGRHPRGERAVRPPWVGRRLASPNVQNVPSWRSVTARWRLVPQNYAPTHFAVRAWRDGRRDRTRIESRWTLFLARGRAALRSSRHEHPPPSAAHGARDEEEESMRPRASLPGVFFTLFERHH